MRRSPEVPERADSPNQRRRISTDLLSDHGEFKYLRDLGQGSFAKVVLAAERRTGHEYAVKITDKLKSGSGLVAMQERECEILQKVSHKNIVNLVRIYESSSTLWIVLENCDKGNLKQYFNKNHTLCEDETRFICIQLFSALKYLHSNHIVHRDMKMENVLLSSADNSFGYETRITDFGLAIVKQRDAMIESFCGTMAYMSPEVVKSSGYSTLCDIWATGVIMYVLLCGYFPFYSDSKDELARQIVSDEVTFTQDRWLHVSKSCVHALKKLLEKNPAYRSTAAEMLDHPWFFGRKSLTSCDNSMNVLQLMKMYHSESRLDDVSEASCCLPCSDGVR